MRAWIDDGATRACRGSGWRVPSKPSVSPQSMRSPGTTSRRSASPTHGKPPQRVPIASSASFVVHVGDPPSEEELRRRIAETGSESTHLSTALLIGSPPAKLRALIKEGDPLAGQTEFGSR